jgi:hypothetical protein
MGRSLWLLLTLLSTPLQWERTCYLTVAALCWKFWHLNHCELKTDQSQAGGGWDTKGIKELEKGWGKKIVRNPPAPAPPTPGRIQAGLFHWVSSNWWSFAREWTFICRASLLLQDYFISHIVKVCWYFRICWTSYLCYFYVLLYAPVLSDTLIVCCVSFRSIPEHFVSCSDDCRMFGVYFLLLSSVNIGADCFS